MCYGRTVTKVDGSVTSKWIHDGFGRLTRFEQPGWNIDYGYSGFDDTPVSMTDPSGVTGYQYDNRGNLWKLTNPVNEVTEWLYDPAGRLSQRKLGNGTWEEVSYDSRSRVTGIALKKPGATLRQHTYGYNAVSNVTSHSVAGVTTSYGYDLADQLTSESRPGYAASYTYDANGNRATRTVNGVTETYVNDVADKLTSISVGGNTVRSLTYDGRGRRKTDTFSGATSTYAWDAESRLLSVARPGVTTNAFGYNGLDARVSKTDSTGTFGFKRNGAGVTDPVLSDGAATYTPGISERRAGSSKFLHSGMKNADAQSGASANVDSSRTYDAFGNLTGSSGSWSGPFGYAGGFGYQEDPDHGLRLLGHRYYDSSTGRFISKDPIGDGRNWTAYASNRPICCVDANGLCNGCLNGGIAAELGGTFGGVEAGTGTVVAGGLAAAGAGAKSAWATILLQWMLLLGLPATLSMPTIDSGSRRDPLGPVYRALGPEADAATAASGGFAQPARYDFVTPFWRSYEDAKRFKELNRTSIPEMHIWVWANPLGLGKPGPFMDNRPTWLIPHVELPGLGAGKRLEGVRGRSGYHVPGLAGRWR